MLLKENDKVNQFTVKYLIKASEYTSNYRVANSEGTSYFMKMFDVSKMQPAQLTDGKPNEILGLSRLKHDNIIKFYNSGTYTAEGCNYEYMVMEFVSGALLSEYVNNGKLLNVKEAAYYFTQILSGLDYMQSTFKVNHYDITPRNIILSRTSDGKTLPKIIDFGHIGGTIMGKPDFCVTDLNLLYSAPETLTGMFNSKSDAFSATATFYFMLTGKAPWNVKYDDTNNYQIQKKLVRDARKQPLDLTNIPAEYQALIKKGLTINSDDRASIKDLLKMVANPSGYTAEGVKETTSAGGEQNNGNTAKPTGNTNSGSSESTKKEETETSTQDGGIEIKRNTGGGGGFKDVAGMDKLKQELTNRVIWIIKDKEKAEKYRITPPNGMLLYGPPGCGKTFFAEKFAEESGFNYMLVNGSDLGSTYIHGTQGKIAELFKKAKANAPIIVCFDEFDSFVPSRQSRSAEHRAEEINEFLAQLNNCSKYGIFVIGTTNLKEMIDPAILRKGRLDLHYEIPAPDAVTRYAMFKIHLKGRPLSDDLNIDEFVEKTDGYASSDIAFIVNEAAMMAALADRKIEHQDIINSINCNPSSLKTNARIKVGFKS